MTQNNKEREEIPDGAFLPKRVYIEDENINTPKEEDEMPSECGLSMESEAFCKGMYCARCKYKRNLNMNTHKADWEREFDHLPMMIGKTASDWEYNHDLIKSFIAQTLEREREQVVTYLRELMLNLDPDTAESIDMYISKLDSHE